MRHFIVAAVAAFALALPGAVLAQTPAAPAAQAPVREITKIAGEVYRFRNNGHYSVFAVTPAGIIATDPINAAAATWLKDEMKKRWPDKAIKFVVYSHDHADHISGGEVWADTATVIAHDNAKAAIIGEKRPTAVPQITFSDDARHRHRHRHARAGRPDPARGVRADRRGGRTHGGRAHLPQRRFPAGNLPTRARAEGCRPARRAAGRPDDPLSLRAARPQPPGRLARPLRCLLARALRQPQKRAEGDG